MPRSAVRHSAPDSKPLGAIRSLVDMPRPQIADLIAGISVALLLIPQSLAYAQIADMPVVTGLFASALPLIAAAPFGSSPYLQTGPVALTSLLTFAALQGAGYVSEDPNYVAMAGVLAVLVGLFRLVLGLIRAGWVSYLVCEPVMIGFTSAAALIILSSQLPKALGLSELVVQRLPDGTTIERAMWAVTHPLEWQPLALALSALTLLLMLGGRRLHQLFPGVMVAVLAGLAVSAAVSDPGVVVGKPIGIPEGLPDFGLAVSAEAFTSLVVGGLVIALVGYAEPSSIARIYANMDRIPWDANRELVGQGVANVVAGFSGAFPVGGSFSRSSVNRMAGAKTKWSGGITGLVILCFLPFAGVLDPLPQAVLGAIVVGAVLGLLQPVRLVRLRRHSMIHALLAWVTFAATLVLAPNVQWAVLLGVALSSVVHFARPLRLKTSAMAETTDAGLAPRLVRPRGLVWLGSYRGFRSQLDEIIDHHPGAEVVLDLGDDPALDPAVEEAVLEAQERLASTGGRLRLRHMVVMAGEVVNDGYACTGEPPGRGLDLNREVSG